MTSDLTARDFFAAARADRAAEPGLPPHGVNHVIAYGQSLSSGWEGWPALSVAPRHDALMLGDCVRPRSEWDPAWLPVGDPVFRPLAARVQERGADGRLLAPEEVAALPEGDGALGETMLEGAVGAWRRRMMTRPGPVAERLVLASACGVGGKAIEALSAGAEPPLLNRVRDCIALARHVATEAGRSYGVAALLLSQGEANAWALGGTDDGPTYATLLERLHGDIAALADAPALPMFFLQSGGAYTTDTMDIAQAQLDVGLTRAHAHLVAPTYPVTAKSSGHLDANGYRWLGAQVGKVMHRVLTRGEPWRPLHPLAAARDGNAVTVRFHVPVPPLRFSIPILLHGRRELADKGFTLRDDAGVIPLTDVALAGPDSVRLVAERPPGPGARVLYADKRNLGRGHLHDSDPEIAYDTYEYTEGTGHYPSANIPDLVGKPYPLMNWCVAFNLALADPLPRVTRAAAEPPPPRPWWRRLFGG